MKSVRIDLSSSCLASLGILCALLALLTLGGITGSARAQPEKTTENGAGGEEAGEVVTTLTRLDAIPGSTVLLPVVPAGARLDALLGPPSGWIPGNEPSVTIAGRALHAALYRLDGTQRDVRAGEAWLPVALEWTSVPWARAAGVDAGGEASFWVLAVDLPDQPIARHIQVGSNRLQVRWLDPPPAKTDVARMPLLEGSVEARLALGDFLRAEARDPFRRWRCALVADRFTAHSLWGERPALKPISDPVLEAAAAGAEVRARAAIEAARRIDPDLGARLLSALTAVVKMPSGELLPAWPADDAETLELLSGLLDLDRTVAKRRADLEVWLARGPSAVAWVVSDDTGRGAATEPASQEVLVGIANMTDRQVICSCAPEGRAATNAETLLAHRATVLRTLIDPSSSGMRATVVARAGTTGFPLTVVAATPAAAPPGIDLGPLLPDWSMATWLGGRAPVVDAASAATARLFAEASEEEEGVARRWRIVVEARTAPGGVRDKTDRVRIWCGRAGEADAVITLDGAGGASIDTGAGSERLSAGFSETERGWMANVELPAWVTKDRDVVEFGVGRVDSRGVRSAWPRPMMPGQREPGRLGIDLSRWSRLGG